jgi:predicted NAD-dependent protein-ADP-ribosyltransferase YbiA (DUF1768 family)
MQYIIESSIRSCDNEIQFYAFSADARTCSGTGEKYFGDFYGKEILDSISDWRKVLSNFHVTRNPVRYNVDGVGELSFRTVEHAFQSLKFFTCGYRDVGYSFALESGSELSRGDGLDARKARKLVDLSPNEIARWGLIKHKIMGQLLIYKFVEDPESREVLLLTFPCKLFHGGARIKRERWDQLEIIRNNIIKSSLSPRELMFVGAGWVRNVEGWNC